MGISLPCGPVFKRLGIGAVNRGASDGLRWSGRGPAARLRSPIDGRVLAAVRQAGAEDCERVIESARKAFETWREVPAPRRGEVVREFGSALRKLKGSLGTLVTMETGKSLQEGLGEVQEVIDICDYACGLSRTLYGVQTHSERAGHRMFEQWHPLGVVGIITAFNFPAAVWGWNVAIALVCGDVCVWKPSGAAPLTAIACQKILEGVLRRKGYPAGVSGLVAGKGSEVGERLVRDRRVALVSFTGSTRVGRRVAEGVAARFGRSILELGGNNAVIVTAKADLELAAKYVLFGAAGTAGQRCTTTRRVIVEDAVYADFTRILEGFYGRVTVGNPLDEGNMMGPLISRGAVRAMMRALAAARAQGGRVICGGKRLSGPDYPGGCYVTPALVEADPSMPIVREETFAPILYLIRYRGGLEEAIAVQNGVPQGLSSSIFTNDLIEAERFLGPAGSDCGIANVNLGTSGAEIGLAFGGEKETGGGRESGSDAWKSYMRRQTCTVNWSRGITLAQGIKFG